MVEYIVELLLEGKGLLSGQGGRDIVEVLPFQRKVVEYIGVELLGKLLLLGRCCLFRKGGRVIRNSCCLKERCCLFRKAAA